jgi:outer membrane lipoprotein SlyB
MRSNDRQVSVSPRQAGRLTTTGRLRHVVCAALVTALAACAADPSTHAPVGVIAPRSGNAEPGVIVGVREVAVSPSGRPAPTAGDSGILPISNPISVLNAPGTPISGMIAATDHATSGATTLEYIVRKSAGPLVSVTQTATTRLTLGQRVLVIADTQARVVPDDAVNGPISGNGKAADVAEIRIGASQPMDQPQAIEAARSPDRSNP